ncbi:fetuin-B-like isoform X2 [Elgaria multicarinata webbii]|uniref:fetuin-B-like isoform X2 n=1 Tax=Elgaria multicarinata webbii TaxID=159646 RepID=UPI002FCD6B1F
MALLIYFLIGIQVLGSLASLLPVLPEPTPPPLVFLSPPCNSSVVKTVAEMALNKINADRREGYVLALHRIFDVRELPQRNRFPAMNYMQRIVASYEKQLDGSLFYLTLDVLETECHVLSRKLPKDCEISTMPRTVPPEDISMRCGDCTGLDDPTEPQYQEAAAQMLAKFNAESNHPHYFAILNVARATSQDYFGILANLDFIIQETSCPKSKSVTDVSKCPLLPPEKAETGLCQGSKGRGEPVMLPDGQIEVKNSVGVKCHFFHSEATNSTEQNPQSAPEPGQDGHKEESESHMSQHHHPYSAHTFLAPERTVGRVIFIRFEGQQPHGTPAPPQVQHPEGNKTEGDKPLRLIIPPFPAGFSESDTCPGESSMDVFDLELPSRPIVKSPPQMSQTQ